MLCYLQYSSTVRPLALWAFIIPAHLLSLICLVANFVFMKKPPSVKSVQSVNTTFYTLHTYYLKNIKLETGDGLSTIYDGTKNHYNIYDMNDNIILDSEMEIEGNKPEYNGFDDRHSDEWASSLEGGCAYFYTTPKEGDNEIKKLYRIEDGKVIECGDADGRQVYLGDDEYYYTDKKTIHVYKKGTKLFEVPLNVDERINEVLFQEGFCLVKTIYRTVLYNDSGNAIFDDSKLDLKGSRISYISLLRGKI